METTTHSRAKKGGEIGANGEWYEGGKFIATTQEAKKHKVRLASSRKVQVGLNQWVPDREGFLPLWQSLSGVEVYQRQFDKFSFNHSLRGENYASADAIDQRVAYIRQYNDGRRWKAIQSYNLE